MIAPNGVCDVCDREHPDGALDFGDCNSCAHEGPWFVRNGRISEPRDENGLVAQCNGCDHVRIPTRDEALDAAEADGAYRASYAA